MAEEWTPAKEDAPKEEVEAVTPPEPELPEPMTAFIKETGELWDKMSKPPEEKPVEAEKPPEEPKPRIVESATPKEDTHFIPDLDKATPEQIKARLDYLYGKDKQNERQWAEARDFIKKQKEETEKLRAELAKKDIARGEAELDAMQLQVVDLLDRNSPNYNPGEGARLLRELTNRDVEIKKAKEDEIKRGEEFKTSLEQETSQKNLADTAKVITDWSTTRDYAQEGHPLYPHVVEWLRRAYHEAPEHVTVQQIVNRAQQVFDDYVKKGANTTKQPENGGDRGATKPPERMTVSQVIGTPQRGNQAPVQVGEKLSAKEREVAVKLFYNPEAGVTREKAYAMYAEGKG